MAITTLVLFTSLSVSILGSLYHPMMGVAGYLIVYSLYNPSSWWCRPITQLISRPSLISTTFLILGCLIHFRKLNWSIARKEIVWLAFLVTAWCVSYFSAFDMHYGSFKFLEKMTKMFVFLFFFIRVVCTWERFNGVIWVIIGTGIFLAYQAHVSGDMSTGRLENMGGIDFEDSNSFAGFIIVTLILLGFETLRMSMWKRGIFAGAIAIMANAFIMARSRSAFVGIVAAIPYIFYGIPKQVRKIIYCYFICAVVLAFMLIDAEFLDRMSSIDDQIDTYDPTAIQTQDRVTRLDFWKASVLIFKDYPMGIGVNNFPSVVVLYDPRNPGMDPHNTFVLCYSEIGIVGITLFMWILGESVFELRRIRKLARNTEFQEQIDIKVVSLMTVLIVYFLGSNVTHSYLYLEFTWLILSLPTCLERSVKSTIATSS